MGKRKDITNKRFGKLIAIKEKLNEEQGDIIGIDLSRISIIAGIDPAEDPFVVAVEVHYTKNKLGYPL